MRTAQRKVREIAARDRLLVQVALDMVEADGFHNLTLARLADRTEYSKGTVYNHFVSRDDLLMEMSAESVRMQIGYLGALAELPWSAVPRLYATALVYLRHAEVAPVLFECSITARTDAIQAAATPERLRRRLDLERQLAGMVLEIVDQVVDLGGYTGVLPPRASIDVLRASLLGYSAMNLLSSGFSWTDEAGGATRLTAIIEMIAGLGWPRVAVAELVSIERTVNEIVDELHERRVREASVVADARTVDA